MSWLEPISTIATAASLASQISKSSGQVKNKFMRIVNLVKEGRVILPVFGAGGVGKSTVGNILVSENPLSVGTAYTESWLIEQNELPGDVPGTIFVAPGQVNRIDRYLPDLIKKVNEGKAHGMINVVSYGYHSFMGLSYKQHDLFEEGMETADFMKVFLSARRNIELEMLDKIINSLKTSSLSSFFMITLISKQDLWWSDRNEVKKYYTTGKYNDRIEILREMIGSEKFHHEYVPISLTMANLFTEKGELLAQTASGYDQATHLQFLQNFFFNLHEIATSHQ